MVYKNFIFLVLISLNTIIYRLIYLLHAYGLVNFGIREKKEFSNYLEIIRENLIKQDHVQIHGLDF